MCVPGCQEMVRRSLTRRGFLGTTGSVAAAALAPEMAHAAVARKFTSAVDLTHTMGPDFPTFFGVAGIEMEKKFDFAKDGFNLYWWRILEHAGTHLDAPIHFSENGASVDAIPAEALVVPLAVLDVSAKVARDPDYLVSRDDLVAWENKHRRLPENCCVAMHSGWAQRIATPAAFTGKDSAGVLHFPGFAADAAQWLMHERKVSGLAVDTLSLDHGPSKDFRVHHAWLPSGRWGLENVANLDKVPPSGATLVVGVAKVKNATGGPARVLALV